MASEAKPQSSAVEKLSIKKLYISIISSKRAMNNYYNSSLFLIIGASFSAIEG